MNKAYRNDAYAKVTGTAKYTDDYSMPDMLHAVPLHAPVASAILKKVDCTEALAMPGVVRVVLAGDIPGKIKFGQIIRDYPTLVHRRIRSTGDVIALVVAESRKQAMAACTKIKPELEELPGLYDPEEALQKDAELINPQHGSNVCNYHRVRTGDIKAGEKSADLVLEQEFNTSRVEHAYLEPEAALCHQRPDGVMEVIGSMQHPFSTRRFVASTLGWELKDVEVKTVPMGGGFGGKDDTAALVCARAALCARLTGRPVKLSYSREMSMRESYKRHPYKMQYRMGLKRDGKITFVKVRMVADSGAYCSVTPWVTWRSTVQCCGCYEVPNVHCDVYGVYTNNIFTGAFRGFGSPQVNWAIEQLIEMAAEKLGMDEIDFRRINMLHQGSVTITKQVLEKHKVSLNEVMDKVLQEIDYKSKRKRCSYGDPNLDKWYGIGFAISYRGMSLGAEGVDFNSAIINVQQDGSVLLETGVHENGQGAESAMILIAAEELGLPLTRIRYRMPSTSNIPDGGTTVASRGTLLGGGATTNAARSLKGIIAEALAADKQRKATTFEDEKIYDENGDLICSWNEAISLCFSKQIYPYAFGVFQAPRVSWDEETGHGNAYFTWVYGCQAVELEVDAKSGKVSLLNMVAAHDVGRAINPGMVKGQFYGGMATGAGYGLFEEVALKDGAVLPTNLHQYRLMRATDLPEMTAIIVENPDPCSPSKAKGVGEPTLEITAPAIANAIYRATGQRCVDQPIKLRKP
jgi:CO/xanthine dehydrogenase Mo-binding subunit